ncbi:MAG: hypothetical protein E2O39_03840 [Planctomycetota bacterium]|nr:MAG: hypothetical protein E2O39_03840 [Planctomycetota bacterium]
MKQTLTALALTCLAGSVAAQDLVMSEIGSSFGFFGTFETTAAYTFAFTTCNLGDVPIEWTGMTAQHPVSGQNLYRIQGGRIEQLGYSWPKHGFCAVNEASCGTCIPTSCSTLGVGCASTNSGSITDGQGGGAKSDLDATTGFHTHPFTPPSQGNGVIRGRLQVEVADLAIPGAVYLAEVLTLAQDDQLAGNARNNASWREVTVAPNLAINAGGNPTIVGEPAILAWPVYEPSAVVNEVVNYHEGGANVHGYYFLGFRVEQLDASHWRYEYALYNMNSDRAAASFAIPIPCAQVEITDRFYRDVDPHSGEIWSGDDWALDTSGGFLRWHSTETFAMNVNAGVIRWGTMSSFGFTGDRPPADAQAEIGLFVPGTPSTLYSTVSGPCATPICGAENYCVTAPSSAGPGAVIGYDGSPSLTANDFSLTAQGAIPFQFGLFFFGSTAAQVPFGDGFLCIGTVTARINPPLLASSEGSYERPLDFTQPPLDVVTAGSTHFFQLWYRDPQAGGSGFNLSDGLAATFCP